MKLNDLTGHRYGLLTALRRAENRCGTTAWWVRCDCGVEKVVLASNLRSRPHLVKSCGCHVSRRMTAMNIANAGKGTEPGDIFGRWTVLSRHHEQGKWHQTQWLCRCECGTERTVDSAALRTGESRSCGCMMRENVSTATARRHAEVRQYRAAVADSAPKLDPAQAVEKALAALPTDECVIWEGPRTSNNLYGFAGTEAAYRRVFSLVDKRDIAGLDLDHLCRRTLCVNPAHMEPVTRAENSRRRMIADAWIRENRRDLIGQESIDLFTRA